MPDLIEPDWYLKEWLLHLGKKQSSLVNELGWNKSRAHHVWHNVQPYRKEVVNQLAKWLDLEPFELLMPPDQALALRRLRESALAIAADQSREFEGFPPGSGPPGRGGSGT